MQQLVIQSKEHHFKWIDVLNPTTEELHSIADQYQLHPAAVQDCLQPGHLPKYEQFDNTLFIITRYYDEANHKNADSIGQLSRKLAIFYNKTHIITIHRQQFSRFDDVINKYAEKESAFFIVCKLVKACLQTYEEPLAKLDTNIDFYESRIFLKKRIPDLHKNLYFIKRRVYVFRKISNLSKEIIEKLIVNNKRTPASQDMHDYYTKVDTLTEEAYDSINSLLTIYISLSSQRTNEVMRTLTVFTAFFLPLTFIVGVYGMNFSFMPELSYHYGYPAVMLLMLGITIAIWIWFKRKGWI